MTAARRSGTGEYQSVSGLCVERMQTPDRAMKTALHITGHFVRIIEERALNTMNIPSIWKQVARGTFGVQTLHIVDLGCLLVFKH